jgi:hypothetical protein
MGHFDKDARTEQEFLLKLPALYMENACVEMLLHVNC